MPSKLCTVCGWVGDKSLFKQGRCPVCAGKREAERGSRRDRGIGTEHERYARWIKKERPACAECGQPYGDPDNPIQVGHVIPRSAFRNRLDADHWGNFRPECRRDNLRKGDRQGGQGGQEGGF